MLRDTRFQLDSKLAFTNSICDLGDFSSCTKSIDLKQYDAKDKDEKWICYLVDMFSRLTIGAFIPNKKPQTIAQVILENWIGTALGKMDTLHSDNGGEFSNSLMEEVAAMLDMKLTTTSAYSPHQNGNVKRIML